MASGRCHHPDVGRRQRAHVQQGDGGRSHCAIPIRIVGHLSAERCVPPHWRGDTFEIPPSAVRHAASELYPNQAFMVGDHAFAVQFHLEFDARRIEQWLVGHGSELASSGVDLGTLRSDAAKHGEAMARHGGAMIDEWLDGLRPQR